jgi:hypothetical protein
VEEKFTFCGRRIWDGKLLKKKEESQKREKPVEKTGDRWKPVWGWKAAVEDKLMQRGKCVQDGKMV